MSAREKRVQPVMINATLRGTVWVHCLQPHHIPASMQSTSLGERGKAPGHECRSARGCRFAGSPRAGTLRPEDPAVSSKPPGASAATSASGPAVEGGAPTRTRAPEAATSRVDRLMLVAYTCILRSWSENQVPFESAL